MKFVPQTKSQREIALQIKSLSPKQKLIYYPDNIKEFYQPLGKPKSGDWLDEHAENGQSFQAFSTGIYNHIQRSKQNVIYITCLDESTVEEYPIDMNVLIAFLEAFYHPVKVKLTPFAKPSASYQIKTRMNHGVKQLFIPDIFEGLKKMLPKDAYCLIAVTMTDLYPRDDWNFVFGQASITGRHGVFSFARYHPEFYGEEQNLDRGQVRDIMHRRSCRVSAHEIGHMFGIRHCIYYNCLMNGSNSMEESDTRSPFLCPICLRKLQHNISFDELARYKQLLNFYLQHSAVFPNEILWLKKRISNL